MNNGSENELLREILRRLNLVERSNLDIVRAIENDTEASRITGRRVGGVVDEIAEIKATIAVRLSAKEREDASALSKLKTRAIQVTAYALLVAAGWLAHRLGLH
jgi:hypothetical protein